MKQLKVFTGGHPFSLDDIIHVQDGVKESIINIMKGLVSNGASVPNCILYGMVFTQYGTSSFFDISAGAVVLDGEICMFDAVIGVDFDVIPNKYVFGFADTYPANNPVIYANATPRNVHLIRKAQLVQIPYSSTPAVNQSIPYTTPRFSDLLKANIYPSNSAWTLMNNAGSSLFPQFAPGVVHDVNNQVYYRKNSIGQFEFIGIADISGQNGSIGAYSMLFFGNGTNMTTNTDQCGTTRCMLTNGAEQNVSTWRVSNSGLIMEHQFGYIVVSGDYVNMSGVKFYGVY